MTHVLILGAAGSVGRTVVRELLDRPDLRIIAADLQAFALDDLEPDFASRVIPLVLDVADHAQLVKAFRQADVVVNATAMRHALPITRTAIEQRVHLVDLGTYHHTMEQLALSDDAASAGICVVIGAGVAPGLTNVLARYGAEQLDRVDRIRIHSFLINALFESPANVLDRFDAANLRGLVHRNGALLETAPLAEDEEVEFPEPDGRQFVHLMPHPETLTLPRYLEVPNVEFKTGYPPDEDEIIASMRRAGLDSSEPFPFGGTKIAPREFLAALVGTRRRESVTTANIKRVSVEGAHAGRPVQLVYELAVRLERGSATSRITGTMAAIAALEVLTAGVPGVHPAEGGLIPETILRALGERGYPVSETRTATHTLFDR